jgi:hypothetical protein
MIGGYRQHGLPIASPIASMVLGARQRRDKGPAHVLIKPKGGTFADVAGKAAFYSTTLRGTQENYEMAHRAHEP